MVKVIFAGMCLLSFAIELTLWVEVGFMAAILFGLIFMSFCFWLLHLHFTTPSQYLVVHNVFQGNPFEVDPEQQIFNSAEPDDLSDQHPGEHKDRYTFLKESDKLMDMWNIDSDNLPDDLNR